MELERNGITVGVKKRNGNGTDQKFKNFNRTGMERFGKKARTDSTSWLGYRKYTMFFIYILQLFNENSFEETNIYREA